MILYVFKFFKLDKKHPRYDQLKSSYIFNYLKWWRFGVALWGGVLVWWRSDGISFVYGELMPTTAVAVLEQITPGY